MTASDTLGIDATPNKISEHRKTKFSLLTITLLHPLAYQTQGLSQGRISTKKFANRSGRGDDLTAGEQS
jgi:hypothetical protein